MDKICKLCNQVKEINKFKTYKQVVKNIAGINVLTVGTR